MQLSFHLVVDPCVNYKVLSNTDRRSTYVTVINEIWCDNGFWGWYLFVGATGTRMPDKCIRRHRCNTVLPGWLNDNYPSIGDGKISRRVFFFQLPYYCCRFILVHIVTLHRILFNLFVLTVNLNSYCSSKDREVRANRLYSVCLTSVNYGHCGFRARWSRINFDRYIPTRIVSICSKISRGQSKFPD